MSNLVTENVLNEKALFCKAKALYLLGQFTPSMEKPPDRARCNPKNTEAWAEIKCVQIAAF